MIFVTLSEICERKSKEKSDSKKLKISHYGTVWLCLWVDFSHLTLSMASFNACQWSSSGQNRLWTSKWLCENVFLLTSDNSQMSGPPWGFNRSTRYIICWHISVALIGSSVESILPVCSWCTTFMCFALTWWLLYNNIIWHVSSIYSEEAQKIP